LHGGKRSDEIAAFDEGDHQNEKADGCENVDGIHFFDAGF